MIATDVILPEISDPSSEPNDRIQYPTASVTGESRYRPIFVCVAIFSSISAPKDLYDCLNRIWKISRNFRYVFLTATGSNTLPLWLNFENGLVPNQVFPQVPYTGTCGVSSYQPHSHNSTHTNAPSPLLGGRRARIRVHAKYLVER